MPEQPYQTVNRSDTHFMTEIRGHSATQFRELCKRRKNYPAHLQQIIDDEEVERGKLCRRGNDGNGWRE